MTSPEDATNGPGPLLVISAHAGDFVWRAVGAVFFFEPAEAYIRLFPRVTRVLS